MQDFLKECLFAWKARVPVASLHYYHLDADIDALNSRLCALAEGTKVTITKGNEGNVLIEGQPSNSRCKTTWKIYQVTHAFAGRHSVGSFHYQTFCNGTVTAHNIGFERESSPAVRGENLPQLSDLPQDKILPSSILETCWARCLRQQRESPSSAPVTTVAKVIKRFSGATPLGYTEKVQRAPSETLHGPHAARIARQSAWLFALAITYLLNYFLDVNLNVLTMPTVEVMREAAWRKEFISATQRIRSYLNQHPNAVPAAPVKSGKTDNGNLPFRPKAQVENSANVAP